MAFPPYLSAHISACANDTTGKSSPNSLYRNLLGFLQMGVRLVNGPSGPSPSSTQGNGKTKNRRGKTRKLNLSTLDLPLPPGNDSLLRWTKQFLPQLYVWAGSTSNPFGANKRMASEIETLWQLMFPSTVLDEEDKLVVFKVVRGLS